VSTIVFIMLVMVSLAVAVFAVTEDMKGRRTIAAYVVFCNLGLVALVAHWIFGL
jgi:hypothetical protein